MQFTCITRKPSWCKGNANARQRCHAKMAVSRHLRFYQTRNSAIRSADPKNPNLEPNMEWIGCTVCEIIAFKLYRDLETGVRGHSSLKVTKSCTVWYSTYDFIFVFHSNYASIYYRFRDTAAYWSTIATPLVFGTPVGGEGVTFAAKTLGDEKLEWWAYQTVKEFRWYVQLFWHKARVWRTDRIGVAYTRYSMLSRVKLLLVANDCHMGRGWMGAEREVMTSPTIVLAATSAHCKCWT